MKYCDELVFQFYRKSFGGSGGGGGTTNPGGNDKSVQFNASGLFAGDDFFTYDYSAKSLGLGTIDSHFAFTIDDTTKDGLLIRTHDRPLKLTATSNNFNLEIGRGNTTDFTFHIFKANIEADPSFNIINNLSNKPAMTIYSNKNWVGFNLDSINENPGAVFHLKNRSNSTAFRIDTYTNLDNRNDIRFYAYSDGGGNLSNGDMIGRITFYGRSNNHTDNLVILKSELDNNRGGKFKISVRDTSNVNDALIINRYANVGIGDNPSYKLDVFGTFRVVSDTSHNSISIDTSNHIQIGDLSNKAYIRMFGGDDSNDAITIYTLVNQVRIDGRGRVGIGNLDTSYNLTVYNAKLKSDELVLDGVSGKWHLSTPPAGTFDSGFYLTNSTDNLQVFFSRKSNFYDEHNGEEYKRISLHLIDRSEANILNNGAIRYCDFSIVTPKGFTLLSRLGSHDRDNLMNDWNSWGNTIYEGLLYYDTDIHEYHYWNGSTWVRWRNIDVPDDPDFVVMSDGSGGLYTSKTSGYNFQFDTSNNHIIIGTKSKHQTSYHTVNIVSDNPLFVMAHNVHNAGTCGIAFSTSSGNTRYPHVGIFSVSLGANGESDMRFCGVHGGDSATVTANDWFMQYDPRYGILRNRANQYIYVHSNPRFVIQANDNSNETAWIVFKHAEDKCAIVGHNYSSYGRADFRILVNDKSDNTPLDINSDAVLFARDYYNAGSDTHDRRIGINTISPSYNLHVNGNSYVSDTLTVGDGSASNTDVVLNTKGALEVDGDLNVTGSKNAVIKTNVNGKETKVYARVIETPFESWIMYQTQTYISYRKNIPLPKEFLSIVDLSAGNYMVYIQSVDTYGTSRYKLIRGNTVRVYVDSSGTYNIMIMARRKDTIKYDIMAKNKFYNSIGEPK